MSKLFFLVLVLAIFNSLDTQAFSAQPSRVLSRFCFNRPPPSTSLIQSKKDMDENEDDPEQHIRGGSLPDEVIKKKQLLREMFAEMIGTFMIVSFGTGSVMSAVITGSLVGLFQIASVWIIAVTLAISTTASVSGAHLNPSISIAFALFRPSKQFGWTKVIPYICAQLIGAVFASAMNLLMYGSSIVAFENVNDIVRGSTSGLASAKCFGEYFLDPVSTVEAFIAEAFGTAILAFVIFAMTNQKNSAAKDAFVPGIIGLTVGGLIAVLAPLTQAGFNPARDFGPRIVAFIAGWTTTAFQGWWVYVIAPIVGAVIGAFTADKVLYAAD